MRAARTPGGTLVAAKLCAPATPDGILLRTPRVQANTSQSTLKHGASGFQNAFHTQRLTEIVVCSAQARVNLPHSNNRVVFVQGRSVRPSAGRLGEYADHATPELQKGPRSRIVLGDATNLGPGRTP